MARMIRAKLVLQLREAGMSQNEIARPRGMSKHSAGNVIATARRLGIERADVEAKEDGEAYEALFLERCSSGPTYDDPDWGRVHRELAKTGVTLKLLHAEHPDAVNRIFESVVFDEQGFNAAPAIPRLSHKYGADMLERACAMPRRPVGL